MTQVLTSEVSAMLAARFLGAKVAKKHVTFLGYSEEK